MHKSYKILCTLSVLLMANGILALARQDRANAIPSNYQDEYANANMINNKSDRKIQVRLNYNTGKVVGPLPIDKNGAIILNEDFSDIINVVIDEKEFTQGTLKGRPVKLSSSSYSTISYQEGKKGPQLLLQ